MSAEKDTMTAPQRQAMEKAWDLLCEHFDKVLLVVEWETEGEGGEREDEHEGYWHGGALSAIGLAEFAKKRILNSGRRSEEPE